MTSLSTIIGVLPLILGSGPGAASRLTVGITIFGGMLFSTFFTLYVIPTIYSIIGNMIMDIDIQNFSNITIPVNLQRENLYIIRIETSDNRIFTHKIVAR